MTACPFLFPGRAPSSVHRVHTDYEGITRGHMARAMLIGRQVELAMRGSVAVRRVEHGVVGRAGDVVALRQFLARFTRPRARRRPRFAEETNEAGLQIVWVWCGKSRSYELGVLRTRGRLRTPLRRSPFGHRSGRPQMRNILRRIVA
jgi:hypothetical protein